HCSQSRGASADVDQRCHCAAVCRPERRASSEHLSGLRSDDRYSSRIYERQFTGGGVYLRPPPPGSQTHQVYLCLPANDTPTQTAGEHDWIVIDELTAKRASRRRVTALRAEARPQRRAARLQIYLSNVF